MVKKLRCSWRSFVVAALLSALASTLIVAVGPGFSQPNDNAAEQAQEATAENGASEVATTEEVVEEEVTEVATTTTAQQPHNPETGNPNASSVPDTHGHVGSGTGTSTGSQADPGHKEAGDPGYKAEDGKSNGPGTGDEDATRCTNKHQGADEPQGGANYNPGPYDNTCDGDNSENGQGSAAPGNGTPCAGCVGNADDKNPPGQVREHDGKKANDMGYECDGNQGVGAHYGRGNPAHTGDCGGGTTPTPPPPPPCTDNPNTPQNECGNPPECPSNGNGNGNGNGGMNNPNCNPPCTDNPNTPQNECGNPPECPGNSGGSNGNSGEMNPNCRPPTNPPPTPDCSNDTDGTNNGPYNNCLVPICVMSTGEIVWVAHGSVPPSQWWTPNTVCGNQTIPPPPPPVCPHDSDMPGQPAPGGDRNNCYTSEPPVVCPADSDMPGQPVPGNPPNVNNCYDDEPPKLCPRRSDMPGVPYPGGDIRNCYVDTPLPDRRCPAGTDHAGEPIPGGDLRRCDDDVLGEVIEKEPKGEVLGNRDGGAAERPRTRGRILPFTGASILAYLVLALELLGAGALILRARKR